MSIPSFLALEAGGDGAHPASWRRAFHAPDRLLTGDRIAAVAVAAERAGFHVLTFADAPAAAPDAVSEEHRPAPLLDALQSAAYAAPLTRTIILAPVVDTVFTEPFHIATQLATLDYVSGGRAGWIVRADGSAAEGAAVGRSEVSGEGLLQETADAVEANRRLWDSWEDDAVIRDVSTGRYLDNTKLHYADFRGDNYAVKGPSIIPRPPQGQLPIIAPLALAAPAGAEAVLVSGATPQRLAEEVAAARGTGAAVIIDLEVILDARGRSAADRLAELDAYTPWNSDRARFVGSAADLAVRLTELLETVDGVRLHPAVLDVDLPELAHAVLPQLFRAGVPAPPSATPTLRGLLGLARPASRYAQAASSAAAHPSSAAALSAAASQAAS